MAYLNFEIFNRFDFPICIIGRNGELIYKNSIFKESIEENQDNNAFGLDIEHPFYPEYRKRIAHAYRKALEGEDTKCFAVMKSQCGKQMPVEIHLYPTKDTNDEAAILAFFKEVDERILSFDKTAVSLQDINQVENFNIFEYSPFPIFRINKEHEIIAASISAEQMIGASKEDLIDNPNIFLDILSPYDRERIISSIRDIMEANQNFKRINDIKLQKPDSIEIHTNAVLYPLIRNKKIFAVEILLEDKTKIQHLEKKLGDLNKNQILADMTQGLLHSFNNIINIVINRSEMLLQLTEKETVLDGLHIIRDSATDGANQIRRIQDFITRDEEGIEESSSIVDIIEDALEFSKIHFKVEKKENNRNISVTKKYYTKETLKGNLRLLREVFVSMIFKISDSITENGTIEAELQRKNDLIFSVKVSKEYLKDETNDLNSSYLSEIELRRIAEKINLRIYEEESNDEICIKVIIPAKMIVEEKKDENFINDIKLRDLDILVVEDESALSEILFELLDTMGNRVSVCEDGTKGFAEFKSNHYDIIISDYGISGMTGLELLTKVREIKPETVTVLLSGWILNDIQTYSNIVDLYLPKPFQIEQLIKDISSILKKKLK